MRFTARLIDRGRIIGEQQFQVAARPGQRPQEVRADAWREAHEGLDPYSGRWVEITPCTEEDAA